MNPIWGQRVIQPVKNLTDTNSHLSDNIKLTDTNSHLSEYKIYTLPNLFTDGDKMPAFHFKLQNLLNIKEKLEEQKKIELGNATHYLEEQSNIMHTLKTTYDSLRQTLNKQKGIKLKAKELIRLNESISYYEKAILAQQEIINKAKILVEEKREALNQALIERKTYEKLKERALENYLKEEQTEQLKQLDEIISFKYSQ